MNRLLVIKDLTLVPLEELPFVMVSALTELTDAVRRAGGKSPEVFETIEGEFISDSEIHRYLYRVTVSI